MIDFIDTINVCAKNGDRLTDDAQYLYDFDRYASSYALSKIAQEEYAKCFILKLVSAGALEWTQEVRRSLNHHVSKQLMAIILEYVNPDSDDFLEMINNGSILQRPRKVSDAINIYIHEILHRWQSQNWAWVEDPEYDNEAKKVFEGQEDKIKQDALYTKIFRDGKGVYSEDRFTKDISYKEIEKAKRYGWFINNKDDDLRYKEVVDLMNLLKE